MSDQFGQQNAAERDEWLRSFAPSDVTFLNLKTGERIQEPSLVALKRVSDVKNPRIADRVLAVGSAALTYQKDPSTVVFSPLRYGQIADYTVAQFMFHLLYQRLRPGLLSFALKPVFCVHEQEHTTEVEERAIIDAAIQTGARRVILYLESLPEFLKRARNDRVLKNACVLHIEPREAL